MIILEGVSKWFDVGKSKKQIPALSDVTLFIPKGEIVGVIGKSGAGKTTLLKLICGLLVPDKGYIRVMGLEPVKNRKRLSSHFSVLFANTMVLNQYETVKSNLEMLKSTYRVNSVVFDRERNRLSEMFGIADIMNETVRNLSLGQRRRVELVSLFVLQADIMIMDEPCIGLDAYARQKYNEMVKELQERGITLIISSHNMDEIDTICTRIIVMDNGKITFYGDKRELYRTYAPVDLMSVKCLGKLPNMQDLPVNSYTMDDLMVTVSYNTNYITASEIVRVLMQSTCVSEISIKKPSLEDVILAIERK